MDNELEKKITNLYQWKTTISSYVKLIYDQLRELLVDTRNHLRITKDLINRVEALEKASTKKEDIEQQPAQKKRWRPKKIK